jgi:hypothetical protein
VERGSSAPTQADLTVFDQLKAMAAEDLAEWDRIKRTDLAALNAALGRSGQSAIAL